MSSIFELLKKEGRARRGILHTVHGDIQTPVFMNVGTCAAIKGGVSPTELVGIGCQVELSNTYHLHLRPGDGLVHSQGGLQKFTGSWALKVIAGSKVPFLVVQDKPSRQDTCKIVIPLGFSSEERQKLAWAKFMAAAGRCKFYICYIETSDAIVMKRTQANIKKNAVQWETFTKYLESKGKLRK